MDPLLNRLGRLFRSWGVDSERDVPLSRSSDPDQRAAEEELEAFLRGGTRPHREEPPPFDRTKDSGTSSSSGHAGPIDTKVLAAFRTLGLSSNASWSEITAAHRQLLKQHHPDRHSDNAQQTQQATRQSQAINEAFQLLKKHRGQ